MAVIKKKKRKALTKQVKKLVSRYGADVTIALVTGIVTNLVTPQPSWPGKKKRKKN